MDPGPSSQSMRSDWSMGVPIVFKEESSSRRTKDPGPSSQSMRSDWSMGVPIIFKEEPSSSEINSPYSGLSSCLDLRRDCSMDHREDLKNEPPAYNPREDLESPGSQRSPPELDAIFQRLEEDILNFVKQQLQRFHKLLSSEHQENTSESNSDNEEQSKETVLNITLDFLKKMDQEQLAQHLYSRTKVGDYDRKLKTYLQQKFSQVFEGVGKAESQSPLQKIYTELYITEGWDSEVNQEHEVRHIESTSRRLAERSIVCEDIFKQPSKSGESIRVVLTKGVAGVGKTVLTQKFSLDWAEGRAHQDVQLLFPFTFRELNVLRSTEYSLVELLHHCFKETRGLSRFQHLQLLFIFDGLDECRLPLDFNRTRVLTEPTESASVEELMVNLIRGSLLPSARLWITTRPAAANQIPAWCISAVTEVRGFTDLQKEQYFNKRFRDKLQAKAVISHIKKSQILYSMCYIPIFCWILSNVLLHLMETRERGELPHTLTQMYIHLLVVQAKVKNIKYHEGSGTDLHWTPETREMVQSLGKLAFEQLLKGNLIFYESDLIECGLDAAAASVYSGVFTQIFREEPGLNQDKVYCFIHLSVQEFLAALHVHETFYSSGENLLSTTHFSEIPDPEENLLSTPKSITELSFFIYINRRHEPTPEEAFSRFAVDRALTSPNGHLDLFLRFLLGLSLPTNRRLLQGLLTQTGSDQTNEETVDYIHKRLDEKGLSGEKSLNLLHCLNELNDRSLLETIQEYLRGGRLSDRYISQAQWSALSFLLLSSDSDLEQFDLKKLCPSTEGLLGLLPVLKASTKAILSGCNLTVDSCGPLASVLSSPSLTYLDLSNNDLQDLGVELLCEGLKSATCRLETLRLSGCLISERGGVLLASALSFSHSHLRDLDVSYNHTGAAAECLIALRAPQGLLHSLRLDPAGEQFMVPGLRKYSCEFYLDPNTAHRRLLLSEDKQTVTFLKEEQQSPDHEDRFTVREQVLSSTGLMGRCYWEVNWTGKGVIIAVSYSGIRRRGEAQECGFGQDDQSWSLAICDRECSVSHGNETEHLGSIIFSGQLGVFLDTEAGSLSFFEVLSDGDLRHLHTFITTFTEALFPGFGLFSRSSVTLVDLNTQCALVEETWTLH